MDLSKIAIDLDGVLYNWDRVAYEQLTMGGRYPTLQHPSPCWDYLQQNVSYADWNRIWSDEYIRTRQTFAQLGRCRLTAPPQELAYLIGEEFPRLGYKPVAITKRPETQPIISQTLSWMGHHEFAFHEVHFVGTRGSKAAIPCAAYIDDNFDTLVEIRKRVCSRWTAELPLLFLYALPHNAHVSGETLAQWRIMRTNCWDTITNTLALFRLTNGY